MPKVSCILPVFNGERYVSQAIESILTQTYADFDLLIINDGSTDRTSEIINQFASEDPRIAIVERENRGLIATLNEGLSLVTGEYVARMDADDISSPKRFEMQIEYMERNPDVGLLGVAVSESRTWRILKKGLHGKERCRGALLFYNCIGHPGVMIRRSILQDYGLAYNPAYVHAEDYKLWCDIAAVSNVDVLRQTLLYYRRHENQVSEIHQCQQIAKHKRIVAEQIESQFHVKLEDSGHTDRFDSGWVIEVFEAVFQSEIYRELSAERKKALHIGFQEFSVKCGVPMMIFYLRNGGIRYLFRGPFGGARYIYRSLKWQLKSRSDNNASVIE